MQSCPFRSFQSELKTPPLPGSLPDPQGWTKCMPRVPVSGPPPPPWDCLLGVSSLYSSRAWVWLSCTTLCPAQVCLARMSQSPLPESLTAACLTAGFVSQCPKGTTAPQNPRSSFPPGLPGATMRLALAPRVLGLGRAWVDAEAVANPTARGRGRGKGQAGARCGQAGRRVRASPGGLLEVRLGGFAFGALGPGACGLGGVRGDDA